MSRSKTRDRAIPSGLPRGFRGEDQIDGTATTQFTKPTKGRGLQTREAAPRRDTDSGVESSMADLADKLHGGR